MLVLLHFLCIPIRSQDGSKRYTYDRVFSPEEDNATVYREIGHNAIESALNGFNTTIFAYGQTGSGMQV
jgi:kinesin family protein 11